MNKNKFKVSLGGAVVALIISSIGTAGAVDAAAALALARKSDCLKCHAIDKKKDGPSYKSVAEKYKGKPDAEQKLYTHLTTHPLVEVDGNKEEHASLKTKNDADIRNVIQWILSQ